ncbi:MAG: class I SAM-dependent methyltransferase [Alphaproteobacteria bacterium]|nr:class I SAM-dependent methyltransferase [Alphaproteobacteria bacterium]
MTMDSTAYPQRRSAQKPAAAYRGLPFAARMVLTALERIRFGSMTLALPDGRRFEFRGAEPGPSAFLQVHDNAMFTRLAMGGSLGFAEAYLDGLWDSPDVTGLLTCGLLNTAYESGGRPSRMRRLFDRLVHALRANTRRGARRNIHAHYDLGNAFYESFLDETMTYSAARYDSGAESLADAQTAKYAALADAIDLRPGERVLEIGCGWGGFAEYAAARRGAEVTGITISQAQLDYARARMQRAGLSDRVALRFQDYRDVAETYDKVISIEMFEAVGERYWPAYFGKVAEVLKPGGAAALQIITISDASFETYRRSVDFIQKYVFPGGMLPTLSALRSQVGRAGLGWSGHHAFGADYARTLAEWRRRFLARWSDIEALGFDERFKRLWTYYFCYCEAGFSGGSIDVIQARLTKP